jgi:hypothetical protein
MPTKLSLALAPRRRLSRQVAWGCFTTNLTLPGFGSLLAGRAIGYAQIAIAIAGFAITTIFGVRFIIWYFANYTRITQAQDDVGGNLYSVWLEVRWALLGMALFAVAWLWALGTSLLIVAESRSGEGPGVPPKIGG